MLLLLFTAFSSSIAIILDYPDNICQVRNQILIHLFIPPDFALLTHTGFPRGKAPAVVQ